MIIILSNQERMVIFYLVSSILYLMKNLTKESYLVDHMNGLEEVKELSKDFSPEKTASVCGIDADTIRSIARDIASASCAAVYGRMGTCTQSFGTVNSWLIDTINIVTGNLDREGGVMFTTPAAGIRHPRRRDIALDVLRVESADCLRFWRASCSMSC